MQNNRRHNTDNAAMYDADSVYEEILRGFDQAGTTNAMAFAAALILGLCHHVHDEDSIRDAIANALQTLNPPAG
ncbi:MAG: DUF2783 domain-containing protein [Rhodobacteraceae bacterium]|nr:DUF2783 domain-containing protein [Paracoccaceae bacterium]